MLVGKKNLPNVCQLSVLPHMLEMANALTQTSRVPQLTSIVTHVINFAAAAVFYISPALFLSEPVS